MILFWGILDFPTFAGILLLLACLSRAQLQTTALSLGKLAAKQPALTAGRYSRKFISPSASASYVRELKPVATTSSLDRKVPLSSFEVKVDQTQLSIKPELEKIPFATSYYEKTVKDLISAHQVWAAKEASLDKMLLELEQHKLSLASSQDLITLLDQAKAIRTKIKKAKDEFKLWIENRGNWPPNLQQLYLSRARADLVDLETEVSTVVMSIKRARSHAALHKNLEDELSQIKKVRRLELAIESELIPDANGARQEFLSAKKAFDQVGIMQEPAEIVR